MADTTLEELRGLTADFFARVMRRGEQKAQLGSRNSSGTWVITQNPLRPAFIDVTVNGTIAFARNRRLPMRAGAYVIVKPDESGELEVISYDGARADENLGATSPGEVGAHHHKIGSGLEYIHQTRLFQDGLVRIYSDGSTLYVQVEAFAHEGGYFPGGVLSLASNVPSSGLARVVLVSLDPTLNVLQATNGSTVASPLFDYLTAADASDIAAAGAIRLAGIRLRAGQTSISAEADFFEQREFFTASAASGVVDGIGFPINITSAIVIETNRQLVIHETTIDTGGSITLEGTAILHYV